MSDKNKISLEDRGWGQMAAVLDKELPQKKSKRRAVLWFFIFGVIVLASALLLDEDELDIIPENEDLITQKNNSEPISISGELKNSVLDRTSAASNSEITHSKVENPVSNIDQNRPGNISKKTKVTERLTDDKSQPHKNQFADSGVVKTIEQSVITSEIKPQTRNSDNNFIQSPTQVIASYVINPENKRQEIALSYREEIIKKNQSSEAVVTKREQLAYEYMPVKASMLRLEQNQLFVPNLVIDNQNITSYATIIEQTINNNYLFFGGVAGINAKGIGYQLGLGRKFGSNNFSVFVEVGIAHMDYKIEDSVSKTVNVTFNPDDIFTNEVFSFEDNTAVLNELDQSKADSEKLISSLSTVFISTGVNKRLSEKLSVTGGVTFSRFLSVENQELSLVSSNGMFQESLDRYNVASDNLFDSGHITKYEWSARFGLTYRITPLVTLSANYSFGLSDLLTLDDLENMDSSTSFPTGAVGQSEKSIYRKNAELRIDYSF